MNILMDTLNNSEVGASAINPIRFKFEPEISITKILNSYIGQYVDIDGDGYYSVFPEYWDTICDYLKSSGYQYNIVEDNTTAAVAGFDSPRIFRRLRDNEVERDGYKIVPKTNKHFKPMNENKSLYKKMMHNLNEIAYRDYKADESSSASQKINKSIMEINRKLVEVANIIKLNSKLKTESGFTSDGYWKRAQAGFGKISERLNVISAKIKELSQ